MNNTEEDHPLKTLRQKLGGISQEEMARRLGVSVGSVSRWERGKTPMTLSLTQIQALITQLQSAQMSLDEFSTFGETGSRHDGD